MASLNGISVKGLKSMKGPEGTVWAGELYLNNVTVGSWYNDYYGGPDHFELLPGYDDRKLVAEMCRKCSEWELEWDLASGGIFMGRLIDLILEEQLFCKVIGDSGKLLLSISDGCHGIHMELPEEYAGLSDEEILKKDAEQILECKKGLLPEMGMVTHVIKIRRKTEDFCVGAPMVLDAIRTD